MIYKLKTDNYKNFNIYKDNLLDPTAYFIPFGNAEKLLQTDIRTERYQSDLVTCLSGEWQFKYYKNRNEIPDSFDSAAEQMDTVPVPSTWQHTGYEPPYYLNTRYPFKPAPPDIPADCPAGVYLKKFQIDNTALHYTITFLGVAGAMDLFCNGKYVGYSEGSHNTAAFDLTPYVNTGENELAVVNHKWCSGTYMECQDMFRCNGIFRDVLLRKSSNTALTDFEAKTAFTGSTYNLDVLLTLTSGGADIKAELTKDGAALAVQTVHANDKLETLSFRNLEVLSWSAETPEVYDLILTISKENTIVETVRRPIGFKHIEIKGNVFYFNNQPVKLLGVNHHDTNPKTGYVLTVEEMERDIRIFKDYNVNCVRTSHYPPDPAFLDLCDAYGIYVVDEADYETHGCETELHRPGAISHNEKWQNHYWDRVYRMFCRDKNHPSVTMWSLGNEAHGYKNQDYCYHELKKRTTIPIHYEGVCRTRRWAYDVVSQMYPTHAVVKKIANGSGLPKKYYRAPYFMCEYAHAMGMGAGDLEPYVLDIYRGENMLGGCIWEFADHAVYHANRQVRYTYGGDHGEEKHDSNFCVDGLFYPDRTPHAGACQMKNVYRPVRARKLASNQFSFFNHRYFKTGSIQVQWQLRSDGTPIKTGAFLCTAAPQQAQEVTLDFNIDDRQHSHNVLLFRYYENEQEIAFEQFELTAPAIPFIQPKTEAPLVQISEDKLFVHFNHGYLIYNAENGKIEKYVYAGKEMLHPAPIGEQGITVSLFRAPLDNDMYIKKNWLKYGLDREAFYAKKPCNAAHAYDMVGNAVVITNTYVLSTPKCRQLGSFTLTYTIYKTGKISIKIQSNAPVRRIRHIPRFGAVLEMPDSFNRVQYYGMGPMQSLSDFALHCHTGIFETTVENMHEDYIKPQESAGRTDTRWAQITDDNGFGLRFEAIETPFIFSADPYTSALCAKTAHREELPKRGTTCVHIDSYQLGAGSNACGSIPQKKHTLSNLEGKAFSFSIEPIGDCNV